MSDPRRDRPRSSLRLPVVMTILGALAAVALVAWAVVRMRAAGLG